MDSAFKLFSEKPISQVTIEQIAKKAGYSPNSVYRYFKNKLYLLHCVAERLYDGYLEKIGNLAAHSQQFDEFSGYEQAEFILYNGVELLISHHEDLAFSEAYWNYLSNPLESYLQDELINGFRHPNTEMLIDALCKGFKDGTVSRTFTIGLLDNSEQILKTFTVAEPKYQDLQKLSPKEMLLAKEADLLGHVIWSLMQGNITNLMRFKPMFKSEEEIHWFFKKGVQIILAGIKEIN